MKFVTFFILSVTLLNSHIAVACNAKAALVEYYRGPTNAVVTISEGKGGIFNIKVVEEDGAVCRGAKAYVDSNCQVVVVKGAFCSYEN